MPVALIAEIPLVLIARKSLPANTLEEFVAYAKKHHAGMNFGSAGVGSASHLGCVMLQRAIGVTIQHLPYRGTAPAMQDLIGGRLDFVCEIAVTAIPNISAGNVKPLANLSALRSAALPDLQDRRRTGFAVGRGLYLGCAVRAEGHAGAGGREAAGGHGRGDG